MCLQVSGLTVSFRKCLHKNPLPNAIPENSPMLQRENNIKVLFGTLISCNETADDADWAYAGALGKRDKIGGASSDHCEVKELMGYSGWYYTMGSWADHPAESPRTPSSVPLDPRCEGT